MTGNNQKQLGNTLWSIADDKRGLMQQLFPGAAGASSSEAAHQTQKQDAPATEEATP